MQNIVIIGAGYSGVLTAKKLEKKLRKITDIVITVLDKNPFHTMLTELHEVAAGRVEEDSIKISFKKVFAGRRINFIHDFVKTIDFERKIVHGKQGTYNYDFLVMAAGSRPAFYGIEGAREHAWPLWSFEDAIRLKERILNCFRRAASEPDAEKKRELLSFYVIGAGLTGVEMAGELAEYIPILCDLNDIDGRLVSLTIVDALSRAVPDLPDKMSDKIQKRLEKMGVTICLDTFITQVGENYIDLKHDGSVSRLMAGTVIWVAGIESAVITQQAAQKLKSQGKGRLVTDSFLRSVDDKRVYVAGDNLFFIPEGDKLPVPQMVENCEQSSDIISHNIYAALTGQDSKEALDEYKPKFHGVMVSVGGRYGAARVGSAKNQVNLNSFFAMFVKHFINIIYFIQVLGWNKVISYLKHEFFTIRNRRSFVGGHFSNRTPSFLAVPLRVWLGAAWLFEGVMKIVDGWLSTPKLSEFFGSASEWFDAIITGSSKALETAASDAVTSATGGLADTGAAAGSLLFNLDFLGIIRFLFVSGRPLEDATLADYAFKLNIPLVNKFLEASVLSTDGLQVFMQALIVFIEIIIGLSLIGGLFTTASSVVSLVLLTVFASTTGLYLSNLWMALAAAAFLWGAGSVFGLDYYTTPYLKRKWRNIGWVKRSYLYND